MRTFVVPTCLALTAALTATPAAASNNADVYLLVELPALHTPIARYDHRRDNRVPLNLGLRTSLSFPGERTWHSYFGHTIRGGRTAMDTPMAQFRLDFGWRTVFEPGKQGRPFVELGTGFETIWFADPSATDHIHGGVGPGLGAGLLFDEDGYRGVIGLRLTSAWMSGGYRAEDDQGGYSFQPSNLGLALYVGQVF